ncbi:Alanine-tRNA ligase [Phytophthora megakarya]|uniref:Alanine--tRNA ligase n=1 Tax=Phytophthora megakarya TaxID=4795 RepID=A0A225WBG4_9STRA|nr:Alanine-tRNA ligase [Phytophthora megakarya]
MLRLRRCALPNAGRSLHSLPSAELRSRFLQFFESQDHRVVPSASLVPPGNDSSLLFVNAGMVPFKQAFLGLDGGAEARGYSRATSAQRCVRAGGKHNDLDQVGLTRRHHTMFEMLGNFSFGDYFKEQAIAMCWRFLTQELGLPVDRLHVTVLNSDHEAQRLWKQIAGLPDHKILELDEEENFWAMGDSGPCGPCSEVFWDLGEHIADPDERYLELWNLVFMQFFRNEGESELHALPSCSVDTGMGLERVASVLQGVPSNYHTDVFVPLLQEVAAVLDARRSSTSRQSFTSALQEELDPTKDVFGTGKEIQTLRRGYVLRRIIRRAIRHAQQLGVQGGSDGILASIAVPGWTEHAGYKQMRAIVSNEEKAFEEMLRNGRGAIEKAFSKAQLAQTMLSGDDAFRLYDTYGIPLDITQVLAEEKGLTNNPLLQQGQ